MKEAVFKSLTALICVAIFCLSISSGVDKIVEARKSTFEVNGSDAVFDNNVFENGADMNYTPDITPDGSVDNSGEGDNSVVSDNQSAETPVPGASEATPEGNPSDPTSYSKEQIVKYYNECMNKSYGAPKVTIKKTDIIAINVESIKPGGDMATNIANKIIEKYAKTTEETKSFVKGGATDDASYKASAFAVPAELDPRGAKTATVTKKGNDYVISIQVVNEAATLKKFPVYNKQCSFPLDLAAVDLMGFKVTSADFNYPGTVLKAVVSADGYVRTAEVYMPMAGGGQGSLIGINGSATVSGSLKKTLAFTY